MTSDLTCAPYLTDWKKTDGQGDNYQSVFLNMKRQWNEAIASYVIRERQWKMVAFLALSLSLLCAGGMVYLGSQNKIVPYVVAVDKLGSAVAVTRADTATKPDARIIRAQLAQWIESVRSVYQDAGAERANITTAYSMIRKTDPAFRLLNDYFTQDDPFQRAVSEGVSVEISTVLPISEKTWQVQWTEKVHSSQGDLLRSTPMQANLSVALDPPTDEAALLKNPMGVYITQYHWSTRL